MRRTLSWRRAATCGLAAGLAASAAYAQEPVQRLQRLPAYGRSIVGTDDSTAIVQNPANVGFLPATELRWSSFYLDERAEIPAQGHAFALGVPLPFIPLATGLRLDLVDPPITAGRAMQLGGSNYQWLTWALAVRPASNVSFGFSLQRTYSSTSLAHGLSSWSFGFTSRPFNHLGMSFVASDINRPRNDAGGVVDPAYDIALAVRPFQSQVVELGLEAKYLDSEPGFWIPRATLGVDIPSFGRVRGEFSISDPSEETRERAWTVGGSLALHWSTPGGSFELAAGSIGGTGLGTDARSRAYNNLNADVAFKAWREPASIEAPRFALRLRIESTPDVREHVALLKRLWGIAEREDKVDAVVLELRTAPGDTLAHVQELRDALFHLRRHGKRVLCHLEDADGASLYLCSAANRILINPAGGIRFAGLKTRHLYFKSLLDKLGIRADFVRIGEHKSAPERLTREGSTETSRADKIDLLQQHERQYVEALAAGRHLAPATLRERIARGPFIASEAHAAGLVDGYAFDDQLDDAVTALVGRRTLLLEDKRAPRAPEYFGQVPGVALVYVDGDMVDGRSETIPFLGMKLVGSYTIAENLKKVREDPLVAAVVLRVETGGGSAMAADVMWREVQLTARQKPVIVSMGSYAASGGYYIAAPATYIFANPLTLTGSIGIFYGKADIAELLRKIGVSVEVYKTAPRADAESIFRPFSDEERQELVRKVGQFYDMFLSRVALGRKLSKQDVDKVGQGRVWTGEQAHARRLVDEIGGLRQALEYARRAAGIPDYAPIVELPPPDTSLIGRLLGIEGLHSKFAQMPMPPALAEMVRAIGPFVVFPPDKAMAKIELVPVTP
ncbi:MAG TPA: signal peptide peptidase SppA [Polyangiaceae bacterium]|nr:signal peptide peptidase SppA [Polyangiaceae bacterium]